MQQNLSRPTKSASGIPWWNSGIPRFTVGQVCTDNLSKANLHNNHFASVFTHEDLSHIPKISVNQEPDNPDVDIQIEGVIKLLQGLDSLKATRPDNIPANLLKQIASQIALLLTLMYI